MTDITGRLVFDSWSDSAPDLRGLTTERHLIYEAGGIVLDLLLRPIDGGAVLHVGGQVMPDDGSPESVSNVPVLLENGSASTATRTNALGEFTLRHEARHRSIDITIVLASRRFLVRGLESSEPRMWSIVATGANGRSVGETAR